MNVFPAKQRLEIDGLSVEYVRSGAGQPVVVLVNGSGGPIEGWYKVYAPLADLATVFAYNRAGISGSTKPNKAQSGAVVVATLRATLAQAGLMPPYLLVGHSLGGLYVNLFARQWPEMVGGVVLLEATAPEDVTALAAQSGSFQRLAERLRDAVSPPNPLGETLHLAETVRQINQAGPFPAVPLVVVTGTKPVLAWLTPAHLQAARAAGQRTLATLSPHGKHVLARRSGHFPQFREPELVVEAIRSVLKECQ